MKKIILLLFTLFNLLAYSAKTVDYQEVEEFFRNPKSEYGKKFLQTLNLIKDF